MAEKKPILYAETNDVRPFARLLRGVGFNSRATVTVQKAGLQVQVDEGRTMSASAYVLAALFTKFEFDYAPKRRPPTGERNGSEDGSDADDPPMKQFDVNLNTLLECLNIYGNATTPNQSRDGPIFTTFEQKDAEGGGGGFRKRRWAGGDDEGDGERVEGKHAAKEVRNTGLIMTWKGDGWPLTLILKDDDPKSPTTACNLTLLEPEDMLNDDFDEDNMIVHIIMKSAWLREAISDLDPSCSRITIIARPAAPRQIMGHSQSASSYNPRTERERAGMFRLEAVGNFGKTELDYPNDKEVMDCFKCDEEVKFSYNFSTFSLANRALQASIKVSLRIDNEGFMSLQLMMPQPANKRVAPTESGIIEFKFRALEDE